MKRRYKGGVGNTNTIRNRLQNEVFTIVQKRDYENSAWDEVID